MTPMRQGFTLIETLVVMGIVSVLAGLLLPVLLHARESAHRTQCLTNVKNIALAIDMYLTDWDRYWPSDMRQEVVAYFSKVPRGVGPTAATTSPTPIPI